MSVPLELMELGLRVLQVVVLPLVVWLFREIWQLRREVVALNGRMDRSEAACEHAPKHHDLAQVYERINAVDRQVGEVKGELRYIRRVLDLIQEGLMKGGQQ